MALNSSSLKFTIEVAADQADRALKAMTVAFNEAGASAKIAMQGVGAASRTAGAEVVTLGDKVKAFAREQRAEARTAGFFVGELAQIVPVSNQAKAALTQLGGALVGGGIVGLGLAAAIVAVQALTAAWREEAEAAKKAAEEEAKAAKVRRDAMLKTGADATDYVASLRDRVEAARREAAGIRELATASDWAKVSDMQAAARVEQNARIRGLLNVRIAETIRLLKELDELNKAKADREAYKPIEINAATTGPDSFRYNMPDTGQRSPGLNVVGLPEQIKPGKPDAKAQAAYNAELQRSIDLSTQWGSTLGNVFGQLATGQMSAQQALAAIGQMMIQQITQIAIQSITASASKAGAEAAASQAGIPVVGPALAISAMGAMMSAVLGLLSNVGKRASGGSVLGGSPYIVGELGPELFVPGRSGTIVPNHRMGGMGGVTIQIAGMLDPGTLERVVTSSSGPFQRAMRTVNRRRRR